MDREASGSSFQSISSWVQLQPAAEISSVQEQISYTNLYSLVSHLAWTVNSPTSKSYAVSHTRAIPSRLLLANRLSIRS